MELFQQRKDSQHMSPFCRSSAVSILDFRSTFRLNVADVIPELETTSICSLSGVPQDISDPRVVPAR